MSDGTEKLRNDLKILESMAAKMAEYLDSEDVFWSKIDTDPVQPTVGGYLMRQDRLQALAGVLLNEAEHRRLQAATEQFDQAVSRKQDRFEHKVRQELPARVRQWKQKLQDLLDDEFPSPAYYRSDVEERVIAAVLIDHMQAMPATAASSVTEPLQRLDQQLRQNWTPGAFVWPAEWKPAYPESAYWWLYGKLK